MTAAELTECVNSRRGYERLEDGCRSVAMCWCLECNNLERRSCVSAVWSRLPVKQETNICVT